MRKANLDCPSSLGRLRELGSIPQLSFIGPPYVEPGIGARRTSPRRIAIPSANTIPSFDDIFGIALVSAHFDRSVLVIGMTDLNFVRWQRQLQSRGRQTTELTLLNGRSRRPVDWRTFFRDQRYDLAILHGVCSGVLDHSLSPSYVDELVYAVPAELTLLA